MKRHDSLVLVEKPAQLHVEQFRKMLENDSEVLTVEPNAPISIPSPGPDEIHTFSVPQDAAADKAFPGDPYLTWGFQDIHAHLIPDELESAPMVAVIDTGVDYTHPELFGKIIAGYDYHNDDNDPMDDHGHGTHVSGIIAAEAGNGLGSAGISTKSGVLAIKVLGADGSGSTWNVMQGIYEAADHPDVRVINLSLGTWIGTASFHNAIDYAVSKGKLIVAAAGNANTNSPYFPAFWSQYSPGVIAVAANTQDGCRAYFSNYGYWVTIGAPGVGIFSTLPENSYGSWSGTSMSTPFVAGAAARALAIYPDLGLAELAALLENRADGLIFNGSCWPDDGSGFGHLNLYQSLGMIEQPKDTVPPEIVISEPDPRVPLVIGTGLLDLSGYATDNISVIRVTWNNARGGSGTAEGTDSWIITGLPLFGGQNLITVSAEDAAGNSSRAELTVHYTVSDSMSLELQADTEACDSMEKIYNGVTLPVWNRMHVGKGFLNGFHFSRVPIPQGAKIVSARLDLHCWASGDAGISIEYSGEAADEAAAFTNAKYDLSSRPKTEGIILDSPEPWQNGMFNSSPDIQPILQEIVNRPGWHQGSTLNLFIADRNSSGQRTVSVFEQSPAQAAVLRVQYRLGVPDSGDTVPPQISISDPAADYQFFTSRPILALRGSAADDTGVVEVTWKSDSGSGGIAVGTCEWSIDSIQLVPGANIITVTAVDAAGNTGNAVLEAVYEPPSGNETIALDLLLQSPADDAFEKIYNGSMSIASRAAYVGQGYVNGFRFTGVPIPAGAAILKAVLSLHAYQQGSKPVLARFTAEDSSDAEPISNAFNDLSSRACTMAQVTASLPYWNDGELNDSPDISEIIQELVDRPDWQSGGAMLLLVEDGGGSEKRMILTSEVGPASTPRLRVEYIP